MPTGWMSWSSGKDSALALHVARSSGAVDIVGLVTTMHAVADRVAMHGVRRSVLDAQAQLLGLPVHTVDLPWPCPNDVYESRMSAMLDAARACGVRQMVFGDLFLEDIRAYRERLLMGSSIESVYPLWRQPTDETAQRIIAEGVHAVITCVDPVQAPREIAGRWYDEALLADLPAGVDPCGENGEFHTLVVDGPGFARPLDVTVGATVEQDGFVYADVVLTGSPG